jgi:hypothetical protein
MEEGGGVGTERKKGLPNIQRTLANNMQPRARRYKYTRGFSKSLPSEGRNHITFLGTGKVVPVLN